MFSEADYPHSIRRDKVLELIGDKHPKVMIELGAGEGEDTEQFLNLLGEDDIYVAVEADPRTFQKLREYNDKRARLVNAAISNIDKENGTFHICTGIIPEKGRPHYDGSSTRFPTQETYELVPWLAYEDIQVKYITLDTLIKEHYIKEIDFIWCDVEGATGEVIDGGLKALKKTRYFYTEVKSTKDYAYEGEALYDEIVKKMNAVGFELVFKFQDDALFRNISR